jgi:uncharacterized protein
LIVVSDTSPILNLARIDRLSFLPAIYGEVLIPNAVFRELIVARPELPSAVDFASISWLTVASASDRTQVEALGRRLDAGEAEAIALAVEYRADLLHMDERRGRHIALEAGISVIGLLGVAAHAKQTGLIDAAKPVLDALIQTARFWIGPQLYAEVLAAVGES